MIRICRPWFWYLNPHSEHEPVIIANQKPQEIILLLKSITLFKGGSVMWNSICRIVVTIYVTILTIYKTRVVMQRGHARTTLTSPRSRAPTMLHKHNILNKYHIFIGIGPPDNEGRDVIHTNEAPGTHFLSVVSGSALHGFVD
jgi:hypothetical protein